MKTTAKVLSFLVIAALAQGAVKAQDITVSSAKFVAPLVQKWAEEYSKHNAGAKIIIADSSDEQADLSISIFNKEADSGIAVGRYAILPVANKNSVLLANLQKKKLNGKRLKELFFEPDVLDEDYNQAKENKYGATVYSGTHRQSVAGAFAEHFGFDPNSLRGKKIAGDDIYLNKAIEKDHSGVTFNNLTYIFDLQSRRLKDEIAILPLDLKKEQSEALSAQNLDATLELLESRKIDLIPVEELTAEVADAANIEIQKFLQWVRTEGQSFNHQLGFLKAESKSLAQK
jgi:ABC-type phosphate transport system substrate-binding protein